MLSTLLFWVIVVISSTFTIFWILVYLFYYNTKKLKSRKKRNEKVCVVIPAYNEENNIYKTLSSLYSLNYPKQYLEVIVINDGSTDKTLDVVRRFKEQHKDMNLIIIDNKKNMGKGKSLNKALSIAKGKYFVVLDSDTEVSKNALKNMLELFDRNVGAVISHIKVKKSKNLIEKFQRFEYIYTQFMRNLMSLIGILYITPGAFSLYRTDILKSLGGFDEHTLTEDFEIALRLKYHGYEILFDERSITYTSIPSTLKSYIMQRLRWNLGFIENTRKYMGKFLKKNDFSLFGHVFYPLTIISLLILISYVLINVVKFFDYLVYKINVWFYTNNIFIWEFYGFREYLLSLNYTIIIPISIIMLLAALTYWLAFKHGFERIGSYVSFTLYFIFYSIITLYIWIFSWIYYVLFYKKNKKWFK